MQTDVGFFSLALVSAIFLDLLKLEVSVNTGFNSGRVFAILVWLIHVTAIASVAQTVTLSPTSQSFGNQVLGTTSVVKKSRLQTLKSFLSTSPALPLIWRITLPP